MNSESLLKSINELIKKHEQFFIDNPELFGLVEDRLYKAIDYEDFDPEDDDDPEDFYNSQYDESGISDMFDKLPEDDIDENMDGKLDSEEADKWLQENSAEINQGSDQDSDADVDIPEPAKEKIKENDAKTDKKKVSSSGYREWSPKDKYEDKHQTAMDQHVSDGWSHREAERFAGAHEAPGDFMGALKHKIKPTQPSEKMLATMKGLSGDWLRNAERKIGESAEAKKNPIKHASAKALTAHEDAHGDFKRSYDEFLQSDAVTDLKGRERHKAIKAFKDKWQADNPAHRESAIAAADTGKVFQTAGEERKKHIEEGQQAILDAGKIGGGGSSSGEFSTAAAGDAPMTAQAAAQSVGGAQGEHGFSAGTVKDPALHFAEQNPEYVKSLKNKLGSKLNPDQSQRLKGIQGFKKKGSE